jgi:hypothetical protein
MPVNEKGKRLEIATSKIPHLLDGLFSAETVFHLEDRTQTTVRRLREVRYGGLEPYLDSEPVEEYDSLILWENPGAKAILYSFPVMTRTP